MSKCFQFSIFLFLGIILLGCSAQPQELKTAESLIETAPDSALHILQSMSSYKYTWGANRALYGLLMIQALDRKHLPLKPDDLLEYSINYYEKNKDGDRLATSLLFRGRAYKYAAQYEKATNLYLKSLDEARYSKNVLLLGRIFLDMGDINNIQGDYTPAREKYQKAYTYFIQAKFQSQAFYSRLNIGRTYHEAKDYKTAQQFYKHIINDAKDSVQLGALFQEIGLNFYDSKQLDSAFAYYKKVISFPYIGTNRSIRYSYLANLYYDIKQYDSAFFYANNSFRYEIGFRTQRDCYRIMSNSEFRRGNMREMSLYMNKYVALGDSLRKVEAQIKGSYLESKHNTELKYEKTRNVLWYSIGFIILIIVVSYILYTQLHKRTKKEKDQLQEEHLEQKASIRMDVVIKYGKELQKNVEKSRTKQANERTKANYLEKAVMDRHIYQELLHLNNNDLFTREMDTVLNNMASKLKKRYPLLTEKEIIWCCLSLFDIPASDLYVILDYSVEGLKTMRKRLAPKIGLTSVSQFKKMFENILSE